MARIDSYTNDNTVALDDRLSGTDSVTGRTANFPLRGIGQLFAKTGVADPANESIPYEFQSDRNGLATGYAFVPGSDENTVMLDATLTRLVVSKTSTNGTNYIAVLDKSVAGEIRITDPLNSDNYAFYTVDSIEDYVDDNNVVQSGFSDITLTFTSGNRVSTETQTGELNVNQILNVTPLFGSGSGGSGTGDITAVNAGTGLTGGGTVGAVTLNLENTSVNAGVYGSASEFIQITVDAQGRLTSASEGNIEIGQSQVTGLDTSLAGKVDVLNQTAITLDTSSAQVIDTLNVNTQGQVTSVTTRNIAPVDLGISLVGRTITVGDTSVIIPTTSGEGGGSLTVSERVGDASVDPVMNVANIQFEGAGVVVENVGTEEDPIMVISIPGGSATGSTSRTLNTSPSGNQNQFNNFTSNFTITGSSVASNDARITAVVLRTEGQTDRTLTVPTGSNNTVTINESYTGLNFPTGGANSRSRTFTLITTAVNSEGETLSAANVVRTVNLVKTNPGNPTIAGITYSNDFDLSLSTTDSRIEQWDTGSISFTTAAGAANSWTPGNLQATSSPITVNGTAGENPSISASITYTAPSGATNTVSARTASRTWTTIRSLRFGLIPADSVTAPDAPNFQDNLTAYTENNAVQATLGLRNLPNFINTTGNIRTIQRANQTAAEINNDTITFNSTQSGYIYFIMDTNVSLSQIFDLQVNSNIINSFTETANVGGYRIYVSSSIQAVLNNYQVRLNT